MDQSTTLALLLAGGFSLLIAIIEIHRQSKVERMADCFTGSFAAYYLILLTGNLVTTLIAVGIVAVATGGDPAKPPPAWLANYRWFFAAFAGVFAFEALIQHFNVTFASKGVLTIQDWVAKGRDLGVAAAIAKQVSSVTTAQTHIAQKINAKTSLTDAELNTYVETWLGPGSSAQLEQRAAAASASARLYKALALATGKMDNARTLAN